MAMNLHYEHVACMDSHPEGDDENEIEIISESGGRQHHEQH